MATAESVKAKLEGLIASANAATGNADTTLTQAVDALIAGFGQGGGAAVQTGSFTPAENLQEVNLTVTGTCSNLVIYRVSDVLVPNQRTLRLMVVLNLQPLGGGFWSSSERSSNSGDAWGYASCAYNADYVQFLDGAIKVFIYPASGTYGWMSAGDEYRWAAW